MVTIGRSPENRTVRNTHPVVPMDGNRRVVFKREILVPKPTDRFQNQRFGIELSDDRGAGESYETVYDRLREAGMNILANDIADYVFGTRQRSFEYNLQKVREMYNLF